MYASKFRGYLSGLAGLDIDGTVAAGAFEGNLTGNVNGDLTGNATIADASGGLTIGSVAVVAPLPCTSAQLIAATGLTTVSGWRFDRARSGNVASFGAAGTLTAGGTPTYQSLLAGHIGVHLDASTGDALSANILDPALLSFLAGGRLAFGSDAGGTSHALMGRFVSGANAVGWAVLVNDSGDLLYSFNDDTLNFTGTLAAGILTLTSEPLDVVVQLDRSGADPVARFRWSRNGVNIGSTSVTLAGLVTLSKAGQEFGFGAIPVATPAWNGGCWVQFAFFGSGTQAEGATKALLASQGLGFE